jgi:hypothetical protein
MVQTNVDTNKHEDCNLVLTKPWKGGWNIPSEDEKYPLKRDSKEQNKDL